MKMMKKKTDLTCANNSTKCEDDSIINENELTFSYNDTFTTFLYVKCRIVYTSTSEQTDFARVKYVFCIAFVLYLNANKFDEHTLLYVSPIDLFSYAIVKNDM